MKQKTKSTKFKKVTTNDDDSNVENGTEKQWSKASEIIGILVGIGIALFMGYKYALYSKKLHENDMWFSNIKVCKIYQLENLIMINLSLIHI